MPDTGYLQPTTISQSGSGASWTGLSNALNLGGGYAECQQSASGSSKQIWLSGYDVSGIPGGSTIDGVEFKLVVAESEDYEIVYTSLAQVIRSASLQGTPKADGSAWESIDPVLGGASDKWGVSGLDLAFISDPSFGIAVVATKYPYGDGSIVISQLDVALLKVYYSAPSGPSVREIIQYS